MTAGPQERPPRTAPRERGLRPQRPSRGRNAFGLGQRSRARDPTRSICAHRTRPPVDLVTAHRLFGSDDYGLVDPELRFLNFWPKPLFPKKCLGSGKDLRHMATARPPFTKSVQGVRERRDSGSWPGQFLALPRCVRTALCGKVPCDEGDEPMGIMARVCDRHGP